MISAANISIKSEIIKHLRRKVSNFAVDIISVPLKWDEFKY